MAKKIPKGCRRHDPAPRRASRLGVAPLSWSVPLVASISSQAPISCSTARTPSASSTLPTSHTITVHIARVSDVCRVRCSLYDGWETSDRARGNG
ncbi:hypothetical protein J6590_015809 [Homalodisca vitripennis]|nr:hypothetical protein J6590_015809 [Homalodisca vitripennis]